MESQTKVNKQTTQKTFSTRYFYRTKPADDANERNFQLWKEEKERKIKEEWKQYHRQQKKLSACLRKVRKMMEELSSSASQTVPSGPKKAKQKQKNKLRIEEPFWKYPQEVREPAQKKEVSQPKVVYERFLEQQSPMSFRKFEEQEQMSEREFNARRRAGYFDIKEQYPAIHKLAQTLTGDDNMFDFKLKDIDLGSYPDFEDGDFRAMHEYLDREEQGLYTIPQRRPQATLIDNTEREAQGNFYIYDGDTRREFYLDTLELPKYSFPFANDEELTILSKCRKLNFDLKQKFMTHPECGYWTRNFLSQVLRKMGQDTAYETMDWYVDRIDCPANRKAFEAEMERVCMPSAQSGAAQTDNMQKQENTIFSDQRETVEDTGYIQGQVETSQSNETMDEGEWHVRNVMQKPLPVKSFQWKTSHTHGQQLALFDVPRELVAGPHYNLFATFQFARMHPRITVQINGTKFHSGRLLVVFFPWYRTSTNSAGFTGIGNYTSFPHGVLDASVSNSVTLEIPFTHMYSYFATNTEKNASFNRQTLGSLQFINFNPLRAADTATKEISVTVWVSWDNCELHQPSPAHTVVFGHRNPIRKDFIEREAQSGGQAFVTTRKDDTQLIMTKNGKAQTRLNESVMGEDSFNFKTLMRRYAPVYQVARRATEGPFYIRFPNSPTLSDAHTCFAQSTDHIQMRTPLSHIAEMFTFWQGTLRYKLIFSIVDTATNPVETLVTVYHIPQTVTKPVGLPQVLAAQERMEMLSCQEYGSLVAQTHLQSSMEFEIPFYTPFNQLSTMIELNQDSSFSSTGDIFIVFQPNTTNYNKLIFTYTLYQSAGDDFVCNYLRAAPKVNFRTTEQSAFEVRRRVGDFAADLYQDIPAGDICKPYPNYAEVEREAQAGLLEGVIQTALPTVLDMAQHATGNIMSSVAGSAQNCDKPTDPTELPRVVINSMSSLNFGDGLDKSCRLSLIRNGATVVRSDVIATNTDDLDVLKVCQIPCRLQRLEWKTTHAEKQMLMRIPVRPNFVPADSIHLVKGLDTVVYEPSNLAYVSRMFKYWKGSLKFKIQLVASLMHSGRLIVMYVPDDANVQADFAAHSYYNTITIDLQEKHEIEFVVPYMSCRPWLRCDKLAYDSQRGVEDLGSLRIYVLNRLVTPAGTPQEIDINVFISAGDDFKLAVPCDLSYIDGITEPDPRGNAPEEIEREAQVGKAKGGILSGPVESLYNLPRKIGQAADAVVKVGETVANVFGSGVETAEEEEEEGGDDDDEADEEERPFCFKTEINKMKRQFAGWWSGSANTFTQFFTQFGTSIGTLAQEFKQKTAAYSVVECLQRITSIINDIYLMCTSQPMLIKINAIVNFILTLTTGLISEAKDRIFEFVHQAIDQFCPSREAQAEGSLDIAPGLMAALAATASIIVCGKLPADKESLSFQQYLTCRLKLYTAAVMGFTSTLIVFNKFSDLFKSALDWFLEKFKPDIFATLKLQERLTKIDEWRQFIENFELINVPDMINFDHEFKRKFCHWMDFTTELKRMLMNGKLGREAQVIREYCRKMDEAWVSAEKRTSHYPFRVDPFSVQLFGPAGVGKSSIITKMAYAVNDHLEYPQFNRWCAVNPAEKFFTENYRGQSNVFIDDIFAMTTEEQYSTFLNCKSNTAYPLNMAFSKGIMFESDFLWSTTNIPYPRPACMLHTPALWRRRNVLLEVDYTDEETQQRALDNQFVIRDDYGHCRFRTRNPNREEATRAGRWMTYNETVEMLKTEAEVYITRQRALVRTNLDMMGYGTPPPVAEIHHPDWLEDELAAAAEETVTAPPPPQPQPQRRRHAAEVQAPLPQRTAQTGKYGVLSYQAMMNDILLSEFDPDWLQVLDITDGGTCLETMTGCQDDIEALDEARTYFRNVRKMDFDEYVIRQYYITQPRTTVKGRFHDFIAGMRRRLNALREMDWFKVVLKVYDVIPFVVGAGILTYGASKFLGMLVHRCVCYGLRKMKFRCGVCGKWPERTPFSEGEWKRLFPNDDYREGFILSPEHEAYQKKTDCQLSPDELTRIKLDCYGQVEAATEERACQGKTYSVGDTRVSAPVFKKVAQVGKGPQQLAESRVVPYIYPIRKKNRLGVYIGMNAFALGGRNIIMPLHFVRDGELEYEIFHGGVWMPFNWEKENIVRTLPHKDLVIYSMPPRFHQHKDQTHLFISEKELHMYPKPQTFLITKNQESQVTTFAGQKAKPVETQKYKYTDEKGPEVIIIQRGWDYLYPTQAGHCGGLLMSAEPSFSKFLGFHVCGNVRLGDGTSSLVTREMLEDWIPDRISQQGLVLPPVLEEPPAFKPEGHFSLAGKMPNAMQRRQPNKTQIIPSRIHDKVREHVTEPAVLSHRDERLSDHKIDPLKRGVEKYGSVSKQIPKRIIKKAMDYLYQEIEMWEKPREPAVLTDEQAIVGIPELTNEGYEKIDLTTSPGWPYVCRSDVKDEDTLGNKGKKAMFEFTEEKGVYIPTGKIKNKELKTRLQNRVSAAYNGERVESVWMDCLKDERRSMEKVAAGKTRVFTIAPVDFTLFVRKFTLDFCATMKKNRIKSFPLVGIDVHSLEWDQLYKEITSFSDLVMAGDFSAYDGTIPPELIEELATLMAWFYNNPDLISVFKVMMEEITHTVTLARDAVYISHQGNPSGNPLTVIINCLINILYLLIAYLLLAEEHAPELATVEAFRKFVKAYVYGDDNLVAIKGDILSWFNQETVSAKLAEYGITYTDENKKGITKFKHIDDSTMLKRSFAQTEEYPHIRVPQIHEDTIYEMTNWIHKCPDEEEQLRVSCNEALRFAFFYGKEYFEEFRRKIVAACKEGDIRIVLNVYEDYRTWFNQVVGMGG